MTAGEPYTPAWRAQVRDGARTSAGVIVPLLESYGPFRSVVDVGGGEGWFARAFAARGARTLTVDGPWAEPDAVVDFEAPPYPQVGTFALALCLEVAEHVSAAHADTFVAWLCTLAPVVAFSAAVPGQGGEGHVNEQWPAYWAGRFAGHGYVGTGGLRWHLWTDERVCWWYAQNLLLFRRAAVEHGDGCPAVIHPRAWEHHGHR